MKKSIKALIASTLIYVGCATWVLSGAVMDTATKFFTCFLGIMFIGLATFMADSFD